MPPSSSGGISPKALVDRRQLKEERGLPWLTVQTDERNGDRVEARQQVGGTAVKLRTYIVNNDQEAEQPRSEM